MAKYDLSPEIYTRLINLTVSGPPEQRSAAKLILDCVRTGQSPDRIERLINALDAPPKIDVVGMAVSAPAPNAGPA